MNGVISLAGGLSIPAGAFVLGLTALPSLRRPGSVKPLLAAQAALFVGVLALGLFGLTHPADVPSVPAPRSAPAVALLAAGAPASLLLDLPRGAHRAADAPRRRPGDRRRLRLARRRAVREPRASACGTRRLLRRPLPGDRRRRAREHPGRAGHPPRRRLAPAGRRPHRPGARRLRRRPTSGRACARCWSASRHRDTSTGEHTRRVAMLAATVADELKLSATSRRHLAIGGLLHDIGKLAVPLEILQKPASLTDEEFAAIKRHPGRRAPAAGGARRLPRRGPPAGLRPPRAPRRPRLPAPG